MSKELSTSTFDYSVVDKDTKSKLICLAGQIKKHSELFREAGEEMGEAVSAAHALLAGKRKGLFEEWVECETDIGLSSAYNVKNVWERSRDFPILENLPPTVAYLLAAPKTTDAAIKAVEKALNKGQKATVEFVKSEIKKHAEPKTNPPAKLPSQSDEPPTPAEDEPPQSAPIDAPAVKKDTAKPGPTFNPAELQSESKDAFGKQPPDELAMAFQLREGFKAQRDKLASIKTWITQNENHPGAKVLATAAQRIRTDVDHADSELKFATPFCVCVYCHNKAPKVAHCNACKGLGWITEPIYKAAPKGMQREKVKG